MDAESTVLLSTGPPHNVLIHILLFIWIQLYANTLLSQYNGSLAIGSDSKVVRASAPGMGEIADFSSRKKSVKICSAPLEHMHCMYSNDPSSKLH